MEITAFLERKLARRFRTYDTDGDGFIGREDFTAAGSRTTRAFGLTDDDPKSVRFHEALSGLWEQLSSATCTHDDGRISVDEYKKAFADGLLETQESFDAGYVPFLNAIMAIADEDGDGKLDAEEHVRWTGALMDLSEADARTVHDLLAGDEDLLSTRDLLAAIREFYFSEDPLAAGNWMLGSLD